MRSVFGITQPAEFQVQRSRRWVILIGNACLSGLRPVWQRAQTVLWPTLGGGVGWLIRKYGMSIDNLLSSQVVPADAKVLTASASENDDLSGRPPLSAAEWKFRVVTLSSPAHPCDGFRRLSPLSLGRWPLT